MVRPTRISAIAEMSTAAENAAVVATVSQSASAVKAELSTGKA